MNTKKTVIIIVLFVAAAAGVFFAMRQFGQSKKTIEVSVSESSQKKDQEIEVNVDQSPSGNQEEKEIAEQQPAEPTEEPLKVENKAEEKKVIEQQEPATDNKSTSNDGAGKTVQKLVSWGFTKSSGRKIDTVIVHTSYNSLGGDVYDADKIIDIYKQYDVSAHYLILRDGVIYQLVADQNISWHAGVSEMPDGRKNVNNFSIGVEVINTKDGKFTADQYAALNSLISTLKKKYEIKYVLGHDEIAPGRKTDPWGIDWKKVKK